MTTMRETIADLYHYQSQKFGSRVAYHYPHNGDYLAVSWQQMGSMATEVALGLWQLGVRKGDRVAINSHTRHEWTMIDRAVLSVGGVVVSAYPTDSADQTGYILQHSGSCVAVLEDAGQLEKLNSVRDTLPDLRTVVLIDSSGAPAGDWLSLDDLRQQGRDLLAQSPDLPEQCREVIEPEDMAAIVYTSGTTGRPKGVVISHRNFFSVAQVLTEFLGLSADGVGIVYLPMAHSLQRVVMYISVYTGSTNYYAPEIVKVLDTCQTARPSNLAGVPRIFEKVHARVMANVEQSPPKRRALFHKALAVGLARSRCMQQKQPVPLMTRLQYTLYDKLIFSKLRVRLFGGQVEYMTSGAAPISRELLEFFHSIGLLILEGYGLTETCSPITVNQPQNFKFGTVGPTIPGSQTKIAEDGEILLKGPGVFGEYYKDPEATREAFTEDGWFRSGDIGELDSDGFLRITDRKKNIIITAAGENIAPAKIENPIMNHPYISQAVVHGDKRKYLVALITLAGEEIAQWAQENGKAGLSLAELAQDEAVQAMVAEEIERQNADLASYETVKYFRILPEEFSVEAGTLTPSLKIKRRVIEETYRHLLDEMYAPVEQPAKP